MALRLEASWSIDAHGGLAVYVTDEVGSFEARLATAGAYYTHSDISTVDSNYAQLAAALTAALQAAKTGAGDFLVSWNGTLGYTVEYDNGNITLDFDSGSLTSATEGTNLRRLLGFSGDQTGTNLYESNVRPYCLVIPGAQGRTNYTRDYESPDIAEGVTGDDGSQSFIVKETSRKIADWEHVGEIETVPANFEDAGTPTHADMVDAGTSADDVPWSWEHFFQHCQKDEHRISVFEGSDHEVWELRAEGLPFKAERWTGVDLPIWKVYMRCYLIGRV